MSPVLRSYILTILILLAVLLPPLILFGKLSGPRDDFKHRRLTQNQRTYLDEAPQVEQAYMDECLENEYMSFNQCLKLMVGDIWIGKKKSNARR